MWGLVPGKRLSLLGKAISLVTYRNRGHQACEYVCLQSLSPNRIYPVPERPGFDIGSGRQETEIGFGSIELNGEGCDNNSRNQINEVLPFQQNEPRNTISSVCLSRKT